MARDVFRHGTRARVKRLIEEIDIVVSEKMLYLDDKRSELKKEGKQRITKKLQEIEDALLTDN